MWHTQIKPQTFCRDQQQHIRVGIDAFAEIGIAFGDHSAEWSTVTVSLECSCRVGALCNAPLHNGLEAFNLSFQVTRLTFGKGTLADQLAHFDHAPFCIRQIRFGLVFGSDCLCQIQPRQFVIELE